MSNKYPRRARSAAEQYIIEDRLANVSVKSGEGILDVSSGSVQRNDMRPLTSNIRMSDPE
jgi:hypothetical protein